MRDLWSVISQNRLVLLDAARRLGKTTLMREMSLRPPHGRAFWIDLEDRSDGKGFFDGVSQACAPTLSKGSRASLWTVSGLSNLSGLKLGPLQLPEISGFSWERKFDGLLKRLAPTAESPVVFFFDEMPYLLHKAAKQHGALQASGILAYLRRVANEGSPGLHFVLAGSLGLHHVLDLIKRETGLNPPDINVGHYFPVPALDEAAAAQLARDWLNAGGRAFDEDVPSVIASEAGGIPFYIERIVIDMSVGERWTAARVEELVRQRVADPSDRWHIKRDHFDRLRNRDYYTEEGENLANRLLDELARRTSWTTQETLLESLDLEGHQPRIRAAADVLTTLCRDHLLAHNQDSPQPEYRFRYDVIRRVWRSHSPGGAS